MTLYYLHNDRITVLDFDGGIVGCRCLKDFGRFSRIHYFGQGFQKLSKTNKYQ